MFVLMYGLYVWHMEQLFDQVDWVTSCLPPHNKVCSTLKTSTCIIRMEIAGRCNIANVKLKMNQWHLTAQHKMLQLN